MILATIYTAIFFGLTPLVITINFLMIAIVIRSSVTQYFGLLVIYQLGCYGYLYFGPEPGDYAMVMLSMFMPLALMLGSIWYILSKISKKKPRIIACSCISIGYITVALQLFLYITASWGVI